MSILDRARLKEIRERCEAATPGPWESIIEGRDQDSGSSFILTPTVDLELWYGTTEDQDFVAAARQDIPILLDEIEKLYRLLLAAGLVVDEERG